MAYNAYLCGCYYHGPQTSPWHSPIKQYLPLLDSEVHSTILSTTSRTVLKQTFTNPSSNESLKECIYTFPLYDGVSVVGFTCKIHSRILAGIVREKAKAKEIFDQAVAKGQTAGLLEQAPEASDVFSTKLGNIPAGKSVIVEITYIGELKHHETEGIRFTIPTSIAPRYGNGPAHNVFGSTHAQEKEGIKITVDVNMPEGSFIKGVQSPSHPIAVSMGALSTDSDADPTMNKASATLSLGSAALEKDFVLIVQSKDVGIPKAILETHPTLPHHRALMATLVPKFTLPPSRPEIVFVADRSGSMSGNIPMLISAMKVFLKSIPVGVTFNICSFGSCATFLWPQSKSYTSETLQEAIAHVETFDANLGGTETFIAIKSTIDKRYTDLPLEIMLLTDGDIWKQKELFTYINQQVKETNGKIRVFPLGIGNGVSSALIEGLARAGNGFSQSMQEGERLDNSVVRMLRGALTPHITDYTVEIKYEKDDDDFELIDQVTEGLKVLLSDSDTSESMLQVTKPTISLFDTTADPEKEDIKMQGVDYLPKIPHPKLLQAPHQIPSLFAFSRTTVYLLMSPETVRRNPTAVVLRATSAHGPLALEIPVEALSTPGQTIHQLAARKAVQDLEEGRGWIFYSKDQAGVFVKDRYPSRFEDLVQREAVRIGEQFGVAGKWCSFVAVEANDVDVASGQQAVNVRNIVAADSEGPFARAFDDEGSDPALQSSYYHNASSVDGMEVLQDFSFDSFVSGPATPSSMQQQPSGFSQNSIPASGDTSGQGYQVPHMRPKIHRGPKLLRRSSVQTILPPATQSFRLSSAAYQATTPSQQAQMPTLPAQNPFNSFANSPQHQQQMARQQGQPQRMMLSAQPRCPQASAYIMGSSAAENTPPGPGGIFRSPLPYESQALGAVLASAEFVPSPSRELSRGHGPSSRSGAASRYGVNTERCKTAGNSRIISGRSSEIDGLFPPRPSSPVNWATKSISDKVHALISLQDFEGSWSAADPEIPRIMGIEIPKAPEGVDEKTWVTLLVAAYLEVNCAAEEGTWGLVAEKAKDWLSSTTGLESAWEQARGFVKK